MMGKIRTIYMVIFLTLFSKVLLGQTDSTEHYSHRVRELYNSGITLFNEKRGTEALDTFKLALKYRKKIYGEESYFLGTIYVSIGITYKLLGRNDDALKNYQLAEKNYLLRNDSNLVSLARLYRNIGNIYRAKLDYNNALDYFNRSLEIFTNQDNIDDIDICDANYAIAEIYYLQNNINEALNILKTLYSKTDIVNRIYYSELIAILYQELKDFINADKYYQINIELVRSEYGDQDIQLANSYLNYAEFLSNIYKFNSGMEALEKAFLIIAKEQPSKGKDLADYYTYKGDLIARKPVASQNIFTFKQQKKQNLNEAINLYTSGLGALYKPNEKMEIGKLTVDNCLSFLNCLGLLKAVADSYLELADLEKEEQTATYARALDNALNYYKVIGKLIQRARIEISSDESKLQLATLESSTFSKTIETAYLAYDYNQDEQYLDLAFQNAEQMKSSAVFDKISDDLA
ncbi:MAG: tetratricopeptide repeat protein, partial [Draconibacterium sp.]